MLMKDGNHFDPARSNGEIHGIGKSLEQAAPDSGFDFWELNGIASDARQDVIKLFEEPNPQAQFLVLVPARSARDIHPSLRLENERVHYPWEVRPLSLFRTSSRTSSQGCPYEGLAC